MGFSDDPYGLKKRRMILNRYHQRFKELQREGRWAEALQQFNLTLNYAMESVAYSMEVLQKVKERMKGTAPTQRERINRVTQAAIANAFYDYKLKK